MTASDGEDLFIGVDGGGTRCRVRLRDAAGRLLGGVESGTANVYLDFTTATGNIRTAIDAVLAAAGGVRATRRLHVGLGLAGVSGPAMAHRVRAALHDIGEVAVTHDGDIACLGAHGGADGGLIIAGTGSGGVARVGGRSTTIGGRGFIMGDEGSGARLGLEALRRALRAHDGQEPRTPVTTALMAAFGDDPVAVIEWARTARSSDFGHHAPMVIAMAHEGDPVALSLVQDAAAAIVDLATTLRGLGAHRLCLVGGFAQGLRPFLPQGLAVSLHAPLFDALDGALLFAGCPLTGDAAAPA